MLKIRLKAPRLIVSILTGCAFGLFATLACYMIYQAIGIDLLSGAPSESDGYIFFGIFAVFFSCLFYKKLSPYYRRQENPVP